MSTPTSYVQYPSDGVQTVYGVTFPFILRSHVRFLVNWEPLDNTSDGELTEGADFSWVNDSQITLAVPLPNGTILSIVRETPNSGPISDFADGSTLLADDLDLSALQALYVSQEAIDRSRTTGEVALQAQLDVADAVAQAASADAKADTAVADASAAQAAASQAQSDAAGAVSAAGAATTAADAATAAAGTATTTANTAISIAGNAETQANTATSIANTAETKAEQAIDAVSSALPVTIVTNVAAIPSSPQADELVEVGDSTGIESFSPLTGLPGGFAGDAGLRVRIQWNAGGNTWEYRSYSPNDPDNRYLQPPLPTASTGEPGIVQLSSSTNSTATNQAATPSAVKTANDAAGAAQSTADGAASAAAAAQSTADGAVADAAAAQSTADSASSLASAAQSAASAATTTANSAQSAADSAILQAQEKVSKSGDTMTGNLIVPAINFPSPMGGFRNLIVNGAPNIWQRGAEPRSVSNASGIACDMWFYVAHGPGSITYSEMEGGYSMWDSSMPAAGMAPDRIAQFSCNGVGYAASFGTFIENYLLTAGRQVTFTVWARAANNGHKITLEVNRKLDTRQNTIISPFTWVLGTTWAPYSCTFTVPGPSPFTADVEDTMLILEVWFSGGGAGDPNGSRHNNLPVQTGNIDVGGMQLEYGPVSTPQEIRPIPMEMAMCQRYTLAMSIATRLDQINYNYSTAYYHFPVEMRKTPHTQVLRGGRSWDSARFGVQSGSYESSNVSNRDIINCTRNGFEFFVIKSNIGTWENVVWKEAAWFDAMPDFG